MSERTMVLRASATLVVLLAGCKQPAAAPAAPPPAHAQQQVAAPAAEPPQPPRPPRDQFELDEDTDDPAAALDSMRHNCCDEMPANEVRQHSGGNPPPTPPSAERPRPP